MFCALFVVKFSANIMQSVNIHIIKIFNKTCRWLIKILDLICTFSKHFSFSFTFFRFFSFLNFFFFPVKQQTPPWEVLGTWKWLRLSPMNRIQNSSLCNSFAFPKAQFLMKWCINFSRTSAHPNDKMVKIPPVAEEISVITWNLHAENRLACK